MNPVVPNRRALWLEALRHRSVWARAATLGLPVGILQAVINQGDVWMRHAADHTTLIKTIVSPLVTFSVALISAAATFVERRREAASQSPNTL